MTTNIDQIELQDFLKLSVVLTDFSEFQLRGTGQAELYYSTAVAIVGQNVFSELLQAFGTVERATEGDCESLEQGLRSTILSDEKLGPLARNIIKLWYIGTWYQLPRTWHERFGRAGDDRTFIPSPSSYVEGLLWPAIGAHPPGAKAPGYGTWTEAPIIPVSAGVAKGAAMRSGGESGSVRLRTS
jgi:hypothetical protein